MLHSSFSYPCFIIYLVYIKAQKVYKAKKDLLTVTSHNGAVPGGRGVISMPFLDCQTMPNLILLNFTSLEENVEILHENIIVYLK